MSIIAINGNDGTALWQVETRNEMFTSPQFFDYTDDGIDDVIIGGRDAELRLINGYTGETIWEFWTNEAINPNDEGWFNFYTSQIISDQNGDSYPDILVANGGDHSLDFSELDRPPGHIMIIDGMTGIPFKTAIVPDENETYMSPVICDLNGDSSLSIEDIILMVNMALDLEVNQSLADMNQDGGINILDISILLNLILDY